MRIGGKAVCEAIRSYYWKIVHATRNPGGIITILDSVRNMLELAAVEEDELRIILDAITGAAACCTLGLNV